MTEQQADQLIKLLEELRDNQKISMEREVESLAMQKEQFALSKTQFERAEKLQEQAEQLQNRSTQLVATSHKFIKALIPVAVVLLTYITWLIFFRR